MITVYTVVIKRHPSREYMSKFHVLAGNVARKVRLLSIKVKIPTKGNNNNTNDNIINEPV